jgi:DNA-binding XRE family transcriptional regulator
VTEQEAAYRRLIGKRVRAERVWQELSQDELASKAGVTRNFVSAIERGAQGLEPTRCSGSPRRSAVGFNDLMAEADSPLERRLRG